LKNASIGTDSLHWNHPRWEICFLLQKKHWPEHKREETPNKGHNANPDRDNMYAGREVIAYVRIALPGIPEDAPKITASMNGRNAYAQFAGIIAKAVKQKHRLNLFFQAQRPRSPSP
jgi:hypothetical protein